MSAATTDVFVGAIVTRFRSYRRGIVGAISNRLKSSSVKAIIIVIIAVMIIHVVCLSVRREDDDDDGDVIVVVVVERQTFCSCCPFWHRLPIGKNTLTTACHQIHKLHPVISPLSL